MQAVVVNHDSVADYQPRAVVGRQRERVDIVACYRDVPTDPATEVLGTALGVQADVGDSLGPRRLERVEIGKLVPVACEQLALQSRDQAVDLRRRNRCDLREFRLGNTADRLAAMV